MPGAAELLLLLAQEDAGKFLRAVLRWHARLCHEVHVHDPGEVQVTYFMLAGPSAKPAAQALAQLLQARRFGQAAEALVRWTKIDASVGGDRRAFWEEWRGAKRR